MGQLPESHTLGQSVAPGQSVTRDDRLVGAIGHSRAIGLPGHVASGRKPPARASLLAVKRRDGGAHGVEVVQAAVVVLSVVAGLHEFGIYGNASVDVLPFIAFHLRVG